MIRCATIDGEQAHRRHLATPSGTGYWRSDLLISDVADSPAPQAFLIQQDPQTLIGSHFHEQDQFQVVAEGGGSIGRHPLTPLSVHYASRYTGYGPIVSGGEGLSYFTFRAVTTPYAHFLPEAREKMRDVPRRNLLGRVATLSGTDALRARSETAVETLIEAQPDGVAAWLERLPPRARGGGVDAAPRSDRFYLVCEGAMSACGLRLPRFATAFVSANERDFSIVAGAEGLEVLVLQFPSNVSATPP